MARSQEAKAIGVPMGTHWSKLRDLTKQHGIIDNFVVRPRRKSVVKSAKPESWRTLDGENLQELSEQLADLPTALVDNDEEAKRFNMLVLRTQLPILQAKPGFSALREQMQHCQHTGRAGRHSGHQG